MTVLFDHQIYTIANYGGVSRYFYEVSKRLSAYQDVDVKNSVFLSNNVFTEDIIYDSHRVFPNFTFKGKNFIIKKINEISTKNILKKKFDIFHPTYYETYFLDKMKNKPFVITFYDLIHEKYHKELPGLDSDKSLFDRRKILLEKSAKIIAISNSTKNDIIDIYKIPPSKVEVVYLASSINIMEQGALPQYKDYILFVGNRSSYKNFEFFIKAIAPLILKEKKLKILCAGGGAFKTSELILFKALKINEQVIQINIDDKLLTSLYRNALFFVFPSLYEGFGIPVLEAFGCSCPAILSHSSSLAEIGGDAALYFNPSDKSDILDKVTTLLYDSALRDKMRLAGFERQKLFSWSQTAREHYNIYKKIL